MMRYLKLDKTGVVALRFTKREKDYGGIHLGVPASSTQQLSALTNELEDALPGHSRSVPLLAVPDDFPRRIFARSAYQPLKSLRIGTAVDNVTQIEVTEQNGIVRLSTKGLLEFSRALADARYGDVLLAGDSGAYGDRLWFWPL